MEIRPQAAAGVAVEVPAGTGEPTNVDDTPGRPSATSARFDPDALTGTVPRGALRYLTHALQPGVALPHEAQIAFSGRVRLHPSGRWMPFHATETIQAGRSYRVIARARQGPLWATVHDSYQRGHARSRLLAFGIIPVRSGRGADVDRSARGRLVVESTWLPSTFLPAYGATWSDGEGFLHVTVPVDGEQVRATMSLGHDGELVELTLLRWSDLTEDGTYGWVPFAARVTAHRTFNGITIPSTITATWAAGTEREFDFFHASVDDARFTPQ